MIPRGVEIAGQVRLEKHGDKGWLQGACFADTTTCQRLVPCSKKMCEAGWRCYFSSTHALIADLLGSRAAPRPSSEARSGKG